MGLLDDRLIATLYGAVDHNARWVDLMDLLRDQLRVESVAAQMLAVSRGDLLPVWETRDRVSEAHGALHDSWINSQASPRFRRPPGPMPELEISSDQQCPDYSAAERQMLSEGLARCGLGPAFWISHQIDARHTFSMIFHRPPGDTRDMCTAEARLLQALAPHLRQAIRLWVRLNEAEARFALIDQAGDAAPVAMVACDRERQVAWCNGEARAMLAGAGPLRLRDGVLACATRAQQERLEALIDGRADRPLLVLDDDAGAMQVRACPPNSGQGAALVSGRLMMLAITRPDAPSHYDPRDIAALFGLTPVEAALAAALSSGASVAEFAVQRGIAEGTARLHLKRILAKTGAARQSDLVRRVCRSVAGRPHPVLAPSF